MSREATNILMIEDNPGDARLIRELLSEAGAAMFTLEWIDRLSTGLNRLFNGGIDVILLDLGLPDSQGFDTITRACDQASNVPIVVLTGHDDEMLAIKAMQEGAQDYLIKGEIDCNSLIRAMRYAIERKRLEELVQKAYNELEHKVEERTAKLVEVNERLRREIEERKRTQEVLKESEEKYRTILEGIEDSYLEVDIAGNFKFFNDSFCKMLGYSKDELIGRNNREFTDKVNAKKIFQIFNKVYNTEKPERRVDWKFIRKDGTKRYIEASVSLIKDAQGQRIGFRGFGRDVTERMRAEEALRKAHAELETRVKERTAELVQTNKELEKARIAADDANQAKSDFLACMSHELRTPLNSVIGFSEVLRDRYFGELNEKQADYVNDILESGKHLLSLINDILDLSKVEAGKMELELSRVSIKCLIEDSLKMIREKAINHGINLELNIPEELSGFEISADERKLKQIMFNLLSNAVKFTPNGGTITLEANRVSGSELRVSRSEQLATRNSQLATGDFIEISVADTGMGISPEDQEKIFEEFYQVRGSHRDKTPGTGLGLSLVKSLVEMHKGRIWVESEGEGKGCRFSFVIPAKLWQLEKSRLEVIKDLFASKMASDKILLDHLNMIISLSKRHKRSFILSRLHADLAPLKEKTLDFKKVLEKEKRDYDFFGTDKDGYLYFIFQETDFHKGKAACERLKRKLEGEFEDVKISFSMAVFPEDGASPDALFRKVRNNKD